MPLDYQVGPPFLVLTGSPSLCHSRLVVFGVMRPGAVDDVTAFAIAFFVRLSDREYVHYLGVLHACHPSRILQLFLAPWECGAYS